MITKIIVLVTLIAFTVAIDQESGNPNYKFEYAISDPITGDTKSQSETKSGDTVQGSYQLLEPDGTFRTVSYVADDVYGFRATVSKTGQPVPSASAIAPVFVSAPAPAPVSAPAPVPPIRPIPLAPSPPASVYSIQPAASAQYIQALPAPAPYPAYQSVPYYRQVPAYPAYPYYYSYYRK